MKITTEQIIDAVIHGYPAIVIINGEYYDYDPAEEGESENEE